MVCMCFSGIREILDDPAAHNWLKEALELALQLDPVDVANDAEVLAKVLDQWCGHLIRVHSPCA